MSKTLRRCEEGSTIVEFAIVAPVLLMMIAGAVELGYMAMVRSSLEGATIAAARQALTGACPEEREGRMRTFITERLAAYRTATTEPEILIRNYGERMSDVGTMEPFEDENGNGEFDLGEKYDDVNADGKWGDRGTVGDLGGPGDVVYYEANLAISPLFPFLKWVAPGDPFHMHSATVVRNEPVFATHCNGGMA